MPQSMLEQPPIQPPSEPTNQPSIQSASQATKYIFTRFDTDVRAFLLHIENLLPSICYSHDCVLLVSPAEGVFFSSERKKKPTPYTHK